MAKLNTKTKPKLKTKKKQPQALKHKPKQKLKKSKPKQNEDVPSMTVDEVMNGDFDDENVEQSENETDQENGSRLWGETDETLDEGNTNEYENEIKLHQDSLQKLKKTDPDFYKFLEENDKKLLQFNVSDEDDDEDEEVEKLHKPEGDLEVASDESDFEGGDDDDDETITEGKEERVVTLRMLKKWQADLQTDTTKNAIENAIQAFHAAVARISNDEDEATVYKVEGSSVFNGVIQLCVLELSSAIRRFLGLKSTKGSAHKCKKFVKVKGLLQMYFTDLLKILGGVTSANILTVLLKHLHQMLPLLQSYRKNCKLTVKKLIYLWGTNDDVVRVLSFFCILRITNKNQLQLLDTVLKSMYMTYVVNSKFVSVNTLSSINFMRRSFAEMFALDPNTSYQHIFLYIRQLAIHLRNAITIHKTENIQTVYNWQYINSLKLFGTVLAANYNKSELQPLVFPFIQICLGTLKLLPTAQYLPLRFQVVQILIDFSRSTGVFIPVLPFILEVLTMYDFNKKAKSASKKPPNLTCLLRFSNMQMSESGSKDSLIEEVYATLLEYLEFQSYSIAFPDLSLFCVLQLKQFIEKCTVPTYLKKMKQLLEKIRQNNDFIEKQRKNVDFRLSDYDRIAAWESGVRNKGTPLSQFYENWNKLRTIKKNREMTNTSELADYNLPTIKKIKKQSGDDDGELFPSDTDSEGEINFGNEDADEVVQPEKTKRKKKKAKLSSLNVHEDDGVNVEEKDTVEDILDW